MRPRELRRSLISTISVTGWAWIPISTGSLCAFAMEASEKGRLKEKITWGDVDKIAELLHDIASKKGIGAILAEGIRYAAKTWRWKTRPFT